MRPLKSVIVSVSLFALMILPAIGYAQEDLRSTIEIAVRSDARTANMTEVEISMLIDALTREAQSQGVTAADILWRPVPQDQTTGFSCSGVLCSLSSAFGFTGDDYTIPIWLGACALMLIFLIGAILEYHHVHAKRLRASAAGQSVQ